MNKILIFTLILFLFSYCKTEKEKFPKVQIKQNTFNFNKINYGDTINHKFKIKNISSIPLKINNVGSSCGCIVTNFTKSEIMKGNSAEILVTFTPQKGQNDSINKEILIKSNTESTYIALYLKGEIID